MLNFQFRMAKCLVPMYFSCANYWHACIPWAASESILHSESHIHNCTFCIIDYCALIGGSKLIKINYIEKPTKSSKCSLMGRALR